MAASTPKVVLNASRDIPFNKLVPSQANVRRIKAGVSIEELADDIARRGLIQSLSVRPVLDGEGAETGTFEVTGGGRRLKALQVLVKAKRLSKTHPVPCVVQTAHGTAAEEDSLAENVQRAPLHPLDQFRAFRTLREERGMSDEEVAAAFFVTPQVVRQRLKLTAVSEKLLDLYAEDELTLEQLMGFTVSTDHARQEQVWEALSRGYNKEPYLIRRMLTEGKVSAAERRAVFVGAEAYQAAGGTIARDLFQQDAGGWFEDVPLLDRLVDEKLQAEVDKVVAEGWKWVEVARDFPWGHAQGLRRVFPTVEPLSEDEEQRLAALREEMDRIETEHAGTGEDLPEEVDQRLGEIEAEIASLEERPGVLDPQDVAIGGAYVSLSHEGRVRIERGYVRPQDEPAPEVASSREPTRGADGGTVGSGESADVAERAEIATGGAPAPAVEEDDGDPGRPLSERLLTELTAQRTLALREAMANGPDVAFVAVLHALALRTFYGQQAYDPASCLEIEARSALLSGSPGGEVNFDDVPAAQALARMHEAWGMELPRKSGELWDCLLDLDSDSRSSLFAYCAARTINAVHRPYDQRRAARAHATQLAEALALDMGEQWTPTVANYLGRVTKSQILAAVRQAKGEAAAQLIDHLKKSDMAQEAERLLAGTGWLPAILRTPGLGEPEREADVDEVSGAAASEDASAVLEDGGPGAPTDGGLPAFLEADEDAEPAQDDQSRAGVDPGYGVAAE
jgi:ParB family transcriptional regulator, chromosome partitioning protein